MVHEALTAQRLSALVPEEAAAYFIMRREEGLSSQEQQLFQEWLSSDAAHRREFDRAERAWRTFDDSQDSEILAAMRTHALAADSRRGAKWWPAAAAAAVLLVAVGVTLRLMPPVRGTAPQHQGPATVAAMEYSSARGTVREFTLADGSTMTLDADSMASIRLGADSRTVRLERGRAFFAVAPDRSRPFAVSVAGRTVVAVGTRFDVNRLADALTVTLLDGTVEIGPEDAATAPTRLHPGQQYREYGGATTIRTLGAAAENAVAWRNGLVNFDDQRLSEVAEVMNRYSQEQIVIDDPEVAAIKVSGQFRAGEAARLVATLSEMHNLQSVRHGNRIDLVRRK